MQKRISDALDFRRHGRGEEKRLPGERHQLADALNIGDEPHVEHAVSFVDHKQLDAGEQQPSALGMVEQPAWRGNQHVDAAQQLGILIVERHAANDQCNVELVVLAILLKVLGDLGGEFACRLEDEGARHACARASLLQHGQHRQHEGGGLAGAGLRNTKDIAPCEHVRNGLVLNGRGSFVAGCADGSENFGG